MSCCAARSGPGHDRRTDGRAQRGDPDAVLQAQVANLDYSDYLGRLAIGRVFQGTLRKGQKIRLMWNGRVLDVETLGVLTPKPVEIDELRAGEVGL